MTWSESLPNVSGHKGNLCARFPVFAIFAKYIQLCLCARLHDMGRNLCAGFHVSCFMFHDIEWIFAPCFKAQNPINILVFYKIFEKKIRIVFTSILEHQSWSKKSRPTVRWNTICRNILFSNSLMISKDIHSLIFLIGFWKRQLAFICFQERKVGKPKSKGMLVRFMTEPCHDPVLVSSLSRAVGPHRICR